MDDYLQKFERIIIISLIILMVLTISVSVISVSLVFIKKILTPPILLCNTDEFLDIFGMFLLVLIGIELLHTIKIYLTEKRVHLEVVLMVALIAIARKVIILDLKEFSGLILVGIAAIIVTLSVAYYLTTHRVDRD